MSNIYLSASRSASNVYTSFPRVPASIRIKRYITGAYIIGRSRSTPECLHLDSLYQDQKVHHISLHHIKTKKQMFIYLINNWGLFSNLHLQLNTMFRYQVVPRFLQLITMFRYQTVPTTFTATDYSHVSDRRLFPSPMFGLCHHLNPEARQKVITWIKRTSPSVPTSVSYTHLTLPTKRIV